MSSTFKIMSFLSKGLSEGSFSGFGGWEHNIFKALKKPKRKIVVLRDVALLSTPPTYCPASFISTGTPTVQTYASTESHR